MAKSKNHYYFRQKMYNKTYSALYIILGTVSYASAGVLLELSKQNGYFLHNTIILIYLFAFVFLFFLFIISKNTTAPLSQKQKVLYVSFGLFNLLITYCFYSTLHYYPVPIATLLLMQSAWITPLIDCILNKSKPKILQVMSMLAIIFGVYIASGSNHQFEHLSVHGLLWGLGSAMSYSALIISSTYVAKGKSSLEKSLFSAFGAFILAIFIFHHDATINLISSESVWAGSYAIFAIVLPLSLISMGMSHTSPQLAGLLITLEIPAAYFLSYIFLNNTIDHNQIIGCIIITSTIVLQQLFNHLRLKRLKYFKIKR